MKKVDTMYLKQQYTNTNAAQKDYNECNNITPIKFFTGWNFKSPL